MLKVLFILISSASVALFGCGHQSTPSDQPAAPDYEGTAVEANKLLVSTQPTEDQMNSSIERVTVLDSVLNVNDTLLAVYSISMVWGQIPPQSADQRPVFDWSGNATVNGVGRYAVVVPIDFERGQDSLVPANNPTTIAWQSTTQEDIDGLATLLVLRRDIQYIMEPHFVFTSGMANLDVPIGRMDKFDTVVIVNNTQSLAIRSWRIIRPDCPSGSLSGDWVRVVNTGDSGTFNGTWNGPDGKPLGPLAGRFWTDPDGTRHMKGWWSAGMLTVIAGELEGTWMFTDPSMCPMCGVGTGEFHGRFREVLDENRRSGSFRGMFGIGPGPGVTVMPFRGVWKVNCTTPQDQVN